MKLRPILRAPEGDGQSSGGSGTPAPSIPSTPSGAGDTQQGVKDVWGSRPAPDWVKNQGLTKQHDDANVAAATPTKVDDHGEAIPSPKPGQPSVPVAPTLPTAIQPSVSVVPAAQEPAKQPTVDLDTLAKALERVMPRQQPQGGQTAPQPTEAEIAAQLGVFAATSEDYEAAFGVKPTSDAQLAAYNRHLQNIAKQAVTIGQVLQNRAMEQQRSEMAPYVTAIRSQEAERQKGLFYGEHADLTGYEALVEKEFKNLLNSGTRVASVEEARKLVAEQTRATLKSIGITPAARAPGSSNQGRPGLTLPQAPARKMTTTSVGGRGGSSATLSGPSNNIEAVWGKK